MKIVNFKSKKDIEGSDIYNKELQSLYDEPKWMPIFYKISLIISVSSIGAAGILALGVPFAIGFAICVPTLGVVTIIGINKIKKKMDRDFDADMQQLQQITKMMTEISEKDHKIEKNTACFYQEIENKDVLANLNSDIINNINKFLYMINENYYEKITSKANLRRDELIDKILDQIALYAREYDIYEFTMDEAKPIIKGCFFIEDSLKKEILKEFKESEYKLRGHRHYRILSNNLDAKKDFELCKKEAKKERESTEHYMKTFDVNDIKWYEFLLERFDEVENNEYGSIYNVEWDLDALRDVMAFMLNKFHQDFTEIKGEYFNSKVVISFIYNVFVYATVNNKSEIGINEIIQTFKNWNFFDGYFDLKLEVIDAIFENFDLDYSMHPYREEKKINKENKILNFPKATK